jgi:hypothetical protein
MTWNQQASFRVQIGMDELERAAIRDEGYDPDAPAVIAALVTNAGGDDLRVGCLEVARNFS